MRRIQSLLILAIAATTFIGFNATPASAVEMADGHKFYGYYQLWTSLVEDYKNDAVDARGDSGEDTLFGIQERRARFGAKGKMADGMIGYNFFTEWANQSISMLDYWGTLHPMGGAMEFRFGRFRPMVNYEGGITSSYGLPMIERSRVGIKHSGFMFPLGSYRDLGFQFKFKTDMADIMLSITNGLGNSSKAAGGATYRPKFARANAMLDAMYVIGVIAKPMPGLIVHGSYSMNKHDNAVIAGGTDGADVAVDIDRSAYSAGLKFSHDSGVYLDAEYFFGERGKNDLDGETELKGYFARVGYWVVPKTVVVSARYDVIEQGKSNSTEDKQTSVAASYWLGKKFSGTLEYAVRDLEKGSDTDPSALRLRLQIKF